MKKKVYIVSFVFAIITCLLSLGFNIYFFATRVKASSGIFNSTKNGVLEIKAESTDIGVSYGSAVVISNDGTLITNAHVITYKQLGESHLFNTISVRFVDEENFRDVVVVKYDLDLDIAVLKIECNKQISSIKVGNLKSLQHGDIVYAIGNMNNHGISITSGIVSTPQVNISYNNKIRNVIQCDLTISDGNSGGALIDKNGKLLGITTFRLKDTSNNIIYGISYSIPASTIMEYIKN